MHLYARKVFVITLARSGSVRCSDAVQQLGNEDRLQDMSLALAVEFS
jgi:hypothetical protein